MSVQVMCLLDHKQIKGYNANSHYFHIITTKIPCSVCDLVLNRSFIIHFYNFYNAQSLRKPEYA